MSDDITQEARVKEMLHLISAENRLELKLIQISTRVRRAGCSGWAA